MDRAQSLVTAPAYGDSRFSRFLCAAHFSVETAGPGTCTPCTHNPLGVKGCGEAGAIGSPPAFINALTDALGVRDIAMPATVEKVWRAANAAA